ncbi:benzoate 4-monooxygenase cytochrome P450 [Xylariaceae sp. FL0594]|nr:benzoate 4-monooxygenase cytochrome P450 [Xylariaceae sp. FL0594]
MWKHIITASSLGVALHHGLFITGEWHLQAPQILAAHVGVPLLLYATNRVFLSTAEVTLLLAVYFTTILASIGVYRLYFHRLRNYPGPRLAALSKLWLVWKCRDSRCYEVLENLRKEYGPFVRTGPNEITVFDANIHEIMDGAQNKNTRSDWYDLLYPRISSIFTRNKLVHNARRKMWENALNNVTLPQHYQTIMSQVRTLMDLIDSYGENTITVNQLIYWFAFDNMGSFGFGQEFGSMKNRRAVDGAVFMRSAMTLLGPFSPAIWIPRIGFAFIPGLWKVRDWFRMLEWADKCMKTRMNMTPENPTDISQCFIDEYRRRGGDTKINYQLLSGDTATLMVAGSDTSAPSLILLLYALARYPEHAAQIQEELKGVDITDVKALTNLEHLNGTINESMRLYPSILSFGSRVTPPEGLVVGDTVLPGEITVVAPRYSIGRLPTAYKDPESFVPERWYSRPDMIIERRAFAPFGLGRTACVGKNLALAQLRLASANLLSRYNIRLAGDEKDHDAAVRDLKDQLTANPGKLQLRFEKRDV